MSEIFSTQTRRKNYRFALCFFEEDNTAVSLKTSLIQNFQDSYYQVGDDVVVNWPDKNNTIEIPAKILALESK